MVKSGESSTRTSTKKLRILVLHSNKQNSVSFKKNTRKALRPLAEVVELVFIDAPHAYKPSESTALDLQGIDMVSSKLSTNNKTFWNSSDDPATMQYRGLEESIQYIDDKCRQEGPFQGILGFSQGGCLAGIMARLQDLKATRVQNCNFQFVVLISAFPCRDVRPEFGMHESLGASLITVPSFHSWGLADTLVVPERSEFLASHFKNPMICTHKGAHYAGVNHWPVKEIVDWLVAINILKPRVKNNVITATESNIVLETIPPLESVHDQLERCFVLNEDRLGSSKKKEALILRPYGLHNTGLYHHQFWQLLVVLSPLYDAKGVTQFLVCDFVKDAMQSAGVVKNIDEGQETRMLHDDMMMLTYCLFPYASKAWTKESKRDKQARLESEGEVFYWMWTEVIRQIWISSDENSTLVCKALVDLHRYTQSYEPMLRVDLLLMTGSSRRQLKQESNPLVSTSNTDDFALITHRCIVAVLVEQLVRDEDVLNRIQNITVHNSTFDEGTPLTYDTEVTKMLNLATITEGKSDHESYISDVAAIIPNTKGALQKRTRLRSDIDMRYYTIRYGSSLNSAEALSFDEARTIYSRIKTKDAVQRLKNYLDHTVVSKDALNLLKAKEKAKWKAKSYSTSHNTSTLDSTEEGYQLRVDEPLSYAVKFPEPEPVIISTEEEMAPLYAFLDTPRSNEYAESPMRGGNGDLVFNKGALCIDGRLDLCKQVIGPRGVDSLIKSLALDNDRSIGHQRVQHLLLGNNICGDGLGAGVADLINRKQSGLKTWYIAGNRLTAAGIAPVCEALVNDVQVEQLWLKRNPLGPGGCRHLATMLQSNCHLIVLDLTNTALMHEGALAILSALGNVDGKGNGYGNRTLRDLYLDANGLRTETAKVLGDYLRSGENNLVTLSVACNRFGNEGVQYIADSMHNETSVERLVLASVGLGSEGANHLANMLRVNKTLLHLDIGLMKSTAALSEIPNRIGNDGAIALVDSLRENSTLRSLSLLYNNIHQEGLESIKNLLSSSENMTLTKVVLEQLGVPFNEFTREEIKLCLRRNYLLLSAEEKVIVDEAVNPSHLREIVSVYRVNGSYAH